MLLTQHQLSTVSHAALPPLNSGPFSWTPESLKSSRETALASSPPYLVDLLKLRPPTRSLRSSDAPSLTVPRTQTALVTRACSVAEFGMGYRSMSGRATRCRLSDAIWKLTILPPRMHNVLPAPVYIRHGALQIILLLLNPALMIIIIIFIIAPVVDIDRNLQFKP